jgi:hypothetical protein
MAAKRAQQRNRGSKPPVEAERLIGFLNSRPSGGPPDGLASGLLGSRVFVPLVYRYDPRVVPDGIDGAEETFSMCTFWYVECLARELTHRAMA